MSFDGTSGSESVEPCRCDGQLACDERDASRESSQALAEEILTKRLSGMSTTVARNAASEKSTKLMRKKLSSCEVSDTTARTRAASENPLASV